MSFVRCKILGKKNSGTVFYEFRDFQMYVFCLNDLYDCIMFEPYDMYKAWRNVHDYDYIVRLHARGGQEPVILVLGPK